MAIASFCHQTTSIDNAKQNCCLQSTETCGVRSTWNIATKSNRKKHQNGNCTEVINSVHLDINI